MISLAGRGVSYVKYIPETVNLAELLHELVDAHSIRIKNAGLETDVSVSDLPMPVYIDRDAIEQVILNGVDNAIKYAFGGSCFILRIKKNEPS